MDSLHDKKPWFSIRRQMVVFMAILLLMAVISAVELRKAGGILDDMEQIWDNLHICEMESSNLRNASDVLTNSVRNFILSSDLEDMEEYWNEVEITRTREKALETLEGMNLTPAEEALVQGAKQESDNLMQTEIHAMRLITQNLDLPQEKVPPRVWEEELSHDELALTDARRTKAALNAVFGEAYTTSKNIINGKLSEFQTILVNRKKAEVEAVHDNTRTILKKEHYLNLSFCLLFAAYLLLYYVKVSRPFRRYNEGIQRIAKGELQALPLCGPNEMQMFGKNFNRIYSEWQEQNRRLEELSKIDFLTKLPNMSALEEQMNFIYRNQPDSFALLKIDVDSLRRFNEEYGHLTGDNILILVSRALQSVIHGQGMAVRLGGEEFLAVFENMTMDQIERFSSMILEAVRGIDCRHAGIIKERVNLTASIGCTFWEKRKSAPLSLEVLVDQADLALMFSKKNGKNRSTMYQEDDSSFRRLAEERHLGWDVMEDMYDALERHEFIPYYQPQYDFNTGQMTGAEALVRWQHPSKGILSPGEFIPAFENNGLVKELDLEMFRHVCAALRKWKDMGIETPKISCNFSRLHFDGSGDLPRKIKEIAGTYRIPACELTVEITESALSDNSGYLKEELKEIREQGFEIALDDFGVGYSSLGVLTEFPIHYLKIDKSFLDRDLQDHKNFELLKGVLNIAKALRLKTICEGVETRQQAEMLKEMGCMYAQGYYYSRPVPSDRFRELMKER